MSKLINIDNGGTLTDICVVDGAQVWYTKTLTTPYDLSKCFLEGLKKASRVVYGEERLVELLRDTDHIRYSTTQGTNALVERKGPRVGLILSAGVDDQLLQRTAAEGDLYTALVGARVTSIDPTLDDADWDAALTSAVNYLTGAGANRLVASFSGPGAAAHERRFKRTLLRIFPRHLLGVVPVLCSRDLVDDGDDTRRTWTALINSFLHPAMETFLYHARDMLREHKHGRPLLIFRNDGDSARVAKTVAIRTYGSGPQGGMEGARALARHYGIERLLSMDIGGTTTDLGLVEAGTVLAERRGTIEGVPISFPLSRVLSAGIGGSSILAVREGQLDVGPESTGGAPGPACFGLGGKNATITDVFLLTGLIDPGTYFGGALQLDRARAQAAVEANIAVPLRLTLEDALATAERSWVAKVAESLRRFATIDAQTTLVAFGGAGPFVVTGIAESAGIVRVIIPRLAAVFSAFGIGFSDIAQRYEVSLSQATQPLLDAAVQDLLARAGRDMFAEGFDLVECTAEWWLGRLSDGIETLLPWSLGERLPENLAHNDALSVSLRMVKPIRRASFSALTTVAGTPAGASATRDIALPGVGRRALPVYRLEEQSVGATAVGPCIIEESFFTGRVDAGWCFEVNSNRDVVLTRKSREPNQ